MNLGYVSPLARELHAEYLSMRTEQIDNGIEPPPLNKIERKDLLVDAWNAVVDAENARKRALKAVIAAHGWEAAIQREITIADIKQAVADYYGVSVVDIVSERRTARVMKPRQVAMYLCTKMTGKSLPAIGINFDGRDHTTILYAARKIEAIISERPNRRTPKLPTPEYAAALRAEVEELKRGIWAAAAGVTEEAVSGRENTA